MDCNYIARDPFLAVEVPGATYISFAKTLVVEQPIGNAATVLINTLTGSGGGAHAFLSRKLP